MLEVVEYVAHQVREWAEAHNPDFPDDLCGMCAIASAKLHSELERSGVKSKIYINNSHCFVMWKDYIVDVTATQFDRAPIFIRRYRYLEDGAKQQWWKKQRSFDSVDALIKYQRRMAWPSEQLASRDVVKEVENM